MTHLGDIHFLRASTNTKRIESIDLLRGMVMIIMALDHVRNYFHQDAFSYNPTDLTQSNAILFFTRFITHYCAPIFVLLAGISANLYGIKKNKEELSRYLFTRGSWLVFTELFIVVLGRTFNPQYPFFNLQVIWAIGVAMIVLSVMIYMNLHLILLTGLILATMHNLLDTIHLPGNFLWSLVHEPADYTIGQFKIFVQYPLLPWIGIIAIGYYLGSIYSPGYDPAKRKTILLSWGLGAMALFFLLRSINMYGDAAHWSVQKNAVFSLLSFLNVTKYPPSLLYILITLGPALVFLALAEKPLNTFTQKITVFGRVPFFYYLVHIYLIHVLAMVAAILTGYSWLDMILSDKVNRVPELKDYGFNLITVYLVWIGLILILYPLCKWFDRYKRSHQAVRWWLSYL
ncbi:MAG TPA: heparan-alpha-glucosaminide N-acetyltransferase domain-containing protein [Chitinophagaceae bacterium]|nr:heparan-alpha-glucosaminide N-acetyltransferase domain-containing protein [Chitinophagaceae bacterium]